MTSQRKRMTARKNDSIISSSWDSYVADVSCRSEHECVGRTSHPG